MLLNVDMLGGAGSESSINAVAFKYYGLDPVVTVLASKSSRKFTDHVTCR